MRSADPATPSAAPRPAAQSGADDLVVETVHGVDVRCYAVRPGSVVQVLQDALAVGRRDDVLLVDPALDRTVTYGEFAALVEGAAAALAARCAPGDRVAFLGRNGLEAAVVIWACARGGLIHVGLPIDAPPARHADLLDLVGASLVLVQSGLPLDGENAALLLANPRPWDATRPLPDQDATYSLIPTSGTTGRPKAVRVTGRMTGHAAVFYTRTLGLTPADRTAIHLPFAWVSGHVTQLAPAMHSGGSAVTMPGFTAPGLVEVCREHGVTWLDLVPALFETLLRTSSFRGADLPRVRLAVFGGAPAPAGTLDRVRAAVPGMRLFDVYALSETCAPVTFLPDADSERRAGTVGAPAPYVDLRLVGADGATVARGEPGEIWVRGPVVTPGYWGGAEAAPVTAGGWLRTGDIARMDSEGFLTMGGRAVDLIIRGGVNVYPGEVERALLATGLLADASAVGVPSHVTGQNVAAAVVALPGTDPSPAALRQAVAGALGIHAVPRPLRILDALPRNPNGKVDRAALAALLTRPP